MTKFTDLKLDPKVLKAIAEAGYEQPTPIQAGAIPPALEGRDVLGIAQTGTGKTASFTLPMITMLGRGRARARMPRSLVLCPTRELAAQVAENFDTYAKHTRLTKALLIGGVSFGEQEKLIDRGVDVLIATPGRLLDHFERGKLLLTGVQIMVVDEADRMLDMGFIPDIERIFQLTPFTRQTLFFSATMAPEIERITNTFLHAPERIEIARQATTSETITQRLVELAPPRRDLVSKQKRDLLRALIDAEGEKLTNAIIFCNRKTDVDIVAKSLKKYGYDAAPIHGDLDQSQRTRTLESFRDGGLRLLIASDVAARGLDIPAVSHVFNYDLPSHAEDYVHRIGRTGRAGRLGTAYSIATPSDEKYLTAIESLVKMTLPRAETPEGFQTSSAPVRDARSEDRQEERKSGGTRSRRRGSRRDEQPEQKQDRVEEQPKPQAAERREEPRESNRDNGRENGRGNGRDDRRDSNRDNGRGGNRRDRGAPVKGMGDHVPQFMLVDLWPKAGVTAEDEVETETAAEAPASVPAPEAEAPKPKRSRSRSRSKSSSKSEEKAAEQTTEATPEAPVEAAAEAPAAPAVEAEPASDTPAAEAAPTEEAPKPKRRSRAKKAETPAEGTETPEVATEENATEEAPKPKRRSRAKKVETPAEGTEAATEEAPKPKRRSRAKKAETPAEGAETPEVATEEAPKPKRRSRAKKADPAPEAEAQAEADKPSQDTTEA